MKKPILIVLCSFVLSMIAYANIKNKIIATVNGVPIYQNLFDESYKQNMLYIGHKKVTKKKVLYDLINREIGIQSAKRNGLNKNPIVKRKMEDILFHAQVSKDLAPELKKINVKDGMVKQYYSNFPEYRTAHILFRTRINATEKEKNQALRQTLAVYDEIKKDPSAFSKLANKFSQTSVAPNGGDIGFQPAIKLAPEYFQAIKGKKNRYYLTSNRYSIWLSHYQNYWQKRL